MPMVPRTSTWPMAADALERVAHELPLPLELRGVGEMLQLASAAALRRPGRTAARAPAIRESSSRESRDGVSLLDLGDSRRERARPEAARSKRRPCLGAADALAVGQEIGKRELEFGAACAAPCRV